MMLVYTPYVIRHLIATTRTGIWTWIWSTKHWTGAGSGLLISMLEKPNLFRLIGLIVLVLLMLKWLGMFLKKKHILWCWGWLSLINWIRALTLSPLLKLSQGKLDLWFVLWSFFLLRLVWMSVNLPYSHTWNTVVMSGWWSYLLLEIVGKTDMQDCWSFTCCLSWTLGSSLKYCQLKSFL